MITDENKPYDVEFGLHTILTDYGYTVLNGEAQDYPIGGMITEFTDIHPTDIKDAIFEFSEFFDCDIFSDEASEAFYNFGNELKSRFGFATAAMIITEFFNTLDDWTEAKKSNRTEELLEYYKEAENDKIREFIFKGTEYTGVGFDSFGQFLLTAYLAFAIVFVPVKLIFSSLIEDERYDWINPEASYDFIGSMCSDMLSSQKIDFRIMGYDGEFKKLYTINSSYSLLLFEIINCIENEVSIKKCENCGKLFVPEGRKDTIYCNRPSPQNPDKTCREIGAQVARANKEKNDVVTKEYRKRYLAHKMKVRRHPGDTRYSKILDELTTGMKEWRVKLKDGSATVEQFMEWIVKF